MIVASDVNVFNGIVLLNTDSIVYELQLGRTKHEVFREIRTFLDDLYNVTPEELELVYYTIQFIKKTMVDGEDEYELVMNENDQIIWSDHAVGIVCGNNSKCVKS